MADEPSAQLQHESPNRPAPDGRLESYEFFWRDNYEWLLSQGYRLRSRYQPNWTPSWQGTKKPFSLDTNGLLPAHPAVLDAIRASNGERLMLKRVRKSLHPYEAEIGQFFSSDSLSKDVRNHCVQIYDVLQVPDDSDLMILVMPLLREHHDPTFNTIGEAVEFLRQIFEGLQFMHFHHVAHRDVALLNVMMDARSLYIDDYHPSRPHYKLDLGGSARHYTRTQRPVKYYLTDFGLSRKYKPEDLPVSEGVIFGADRTVPEFQTNDTCDPFPADIYTLGNMLKEEFTDGSRFIKAKRGFEFLKPLVTDMTHPDPTKRPTMNQVVERFDEIRGKLSPWKLRSRVVEVDESYGSSIFRGIGHWSRKVQFLLRRVPAIPRPS